MVRNDAPRASITVQSSVSGGRRVRNLQLHWPRGTGGLSSTARRRTAECSPSAPATRSYSLLGETAFELAWRAGRSAAPGEALGDAMREIELAERLAR
jgi:hypothetical protein